MIQTLIRKKYILNEIKNTNKTEKPKIEFVKCVSHYLKK